MVMAKLVNVTLKVVCERGPHVFDTLEIFEQTDNNLSP